MFALYANHLPFHRTGSAFTPVGATNAGSLVYASPNAVYRYKPGSDASFGSGDELPDASRRAASLRRSL